MTRHRQTLLCMLVWIFLSRICLGHGLPIDILADENGQLTPFRNAHGVPVFEIGEFTEVAGLISADSPGIGVTNAANGIAHDTAIELVFTSGLLYWNGESVAATDAELTVFSPDLSESLEIAANSPLASRMPWATYDGTSFWESHGLYLLKANTDQAGIYAVEIQVDSPSYQASDPFLLPLAFGTFSPTDQDIGLDALRTSRRPALVGDVNRDGVLDANDIDAITLQILSGGVIDGFDVNRDGLLNQDDRVFWVESLMNSYLGDSNLDGQFNSSDLVGVFQAAEFEDTVTANSTWATGDWNGDLEFDSKDFIAAFQTGGYDQPRRRKLHEVPEPGGIALIGLGVVLLSINRRQWQAPLRFQLR